MKSIFFWFLITFILLGLTACADSKENTASCSVQLDKQYYSAVSSNTSCSSYERASAYLGLAGMTFANFMKTGATDNLVTTLNITKLDNASDYTSGNRAHLTNALCLVGADSILTSSRCNNTAKTRSAAEVEISMFANIGDLIYLNHGILDTDLDGTITDNESATFSTLSSSGVKSSGEGTTLSSYSRYEVVAGTKSYIANSDLTKCLTYTDNYTVDPTSGSDCATKAVSDGVTITEIRPIMKLDNMTDITGGGDLTSRVAMVSELTSVSNALDSDFSSLGISSTNELRVSLTAGLSKMDNGATTKDNATCTATIPFDVVFLLGRYAADNSTTSSDMRDKNLISVSELTTSVDSSLSVASAGGFTMNNARLIYATNTAGTTYTDSYEKAHTALYTAMKNMRALDTEASVKGDGKVSFRELLCIGEN